MHSLLSADHFPLPQMTWPTKPDIRMPVTGGPHSRKAADHDEWVSMHERAVDEWVSIAASRNQSSFRLRTSNSFDPKWN